MELVPWWQNPGNNSRAKPINNTASPSFLKEYSFDGMVFKNLNPCLKIDLLETRALLPADPGSAG